MTRFQNALLDELAAHAAERSASPAPSQARRRVRPSRAWSLPVVVAAGVAAAALLATLPTTMDGPLGAEPAYAVSRVGDIVTIEFTRLTDPDPINRELKAAGINARVLQPAGSNGCAAWPFKEPQPVLPPPGAPDKDFEEAFADYGVGTNIIWQSDYKGFALLVSEEFQAMIYIGQVPIKDGRSDFVVAATWKEHELTPEPKCWEEIYP